MSCDECHYMLFRYNRRMAYYDRIAKQWHKATGYKGGPFKEYVLNDLLLDKVSGISGRSILELGIGNGYFMPLLLGRFSGQKFARMVLADQSRKVLEIAQERLRVAKAEYLVLDAGLTFPFEDHSFELILATFVFNEVSNGRFKKAIGECYRVLKSNGLFLMTATHPDFVDSLSKRGQLKRSGGSLTMPGSGSLRVPIVPRSTRSYRKVLDEAGFDFQDEEVFANDKVLNVRPGLRHAGRVPLALVFTCSRRNGPNN